MRAWRVGVLVVFVGAAASVLSIRLALFQIVDHAQLTAIAATERGGAPPALGPRGIIYDDSNNPLAVSDEDYDVYATPSQITAPVAEAHLLAPLLAEPASAILRDLTSKLSYPVVATGVSQIVDNRLEQLTLPGITAEAVPNRVYPEGRLASQLLGFVSANGGQYGIEEAYDPLLSGRATTSGLLRFAHAQGASVRTTPYAGQTWYGGATLHLSIDTYMQDVAEQDLRSVVKRTGAAGGTVIVSNPFSDRIIVMANYPRFNPNSYASFPAPSWRNPAIFDTYEPGSTFKIVTMAAGLNAGVIKPTTTIYDPGYAYYPCDPHAIHNWDYPLGNGRETMTQVLQHSANVGAAYVANLLGNRRFYAYVQAFGIGSLTGIDLWGEQSGRVPLPGVRHSGWSCPNLYGNSFGQALTLTPLQLLNAVNAVANGGKLMRPEVVKRIEYRGVTVYLRPHQIRRVIRRRTARTLTGMLVQSAMGPPGEYGEASCALVPGYTIAAKTGTANLVDPVTHNYMVGPGSTIASTVGYAPAFRPRFSVLVVIQRPTFDWAISQWGSETAAPLVHDIFQSLFLHYHVPPRTANRSQVLASQHAFGECPF